MRQGQPQNRQRSRGRGNNNRNNNNNNNNNRNQLNRSMESNGPDVRIRGTAAHIAEKYTQMANDAQTAGDTVGAQSYFQFAEHYNRLVASAQAAIQAAREEQEARREARGENRDNSNDDDSDGDNENDDRNDGGRKGRGRNQNRGNNRSRDNSRDNDDMDDDDDASKRNRREPDGNKPSANVSGDGPQPTLDSVPAEVALNEKPVETEKAAAPKRVRRPRKPKEDAAPADAGGLPAFVTGAE